MKKVAFGFAAILGLTILASTGVAHAADEEPKWYDRVKIGAFIDTYASLNVMRPRPASYATANGFRAYDQHNGFALHWIGLDAAVQPDPVGGTVSLRFGPSSSIYTGSPDTELNLQNVKQAFVSYKPGGAAGRLTLIAGKFDTIYGAEVADSQLNVTYTRSMLNFYGQPFFHTGFRADYAINEMFEVRFLAVNGWNNAVDNNEGKTFGAQVNFKPDDHLLAAVGYLGGPEQPDRVRVSCDAGAAVDRSTGTCVDSPGAEASEETFARGSNNKRWRHIVDAVVDWNPTDRFRTLFNFDWATEEVRAPFADSSERKVWWGADLSAREKINSVSFIGARVSYFRDRDGYLVGTGTNTIVTSGTLTLGWTPTPNLVVKLEPRLDRANDKVFLVGTHDSARTQFTTTLGIVAMY
jgi:hypothetical protein